MEGLELFLLLPPGIAVVAHKVGVFLESRVVVGGQHLGVGVDVHPGAGGLLQQHLQVPQVMAGHQNAGVGPHADVDPGDFGVAVGRGVGLVQQGHARHTVLAGFQGQGHQVVGGQAVIQRGGQGALQKGVHLGVVLQQGVGVLGIGGKSLEAVGDQFPQRADVLVPGGEYPHRAGLGHPVPFPVPAGGFGQGGGVGHAGQQFPLGVQRGGDAGLDVRPVKVGVGDGGKKVQRDQVVDVGRNALPGGAQGGGHGGQPLGHPDQQVLHGGHIGLFATDTHPGAAFAAGGLLALVTKHCFVHGGSPCC